MEESFNIIVFIVFHENFIDGPLNATLRSYMSMRNNLILRAALTTVGVLAAELCLRATPVTVQEVSVGPNEVVSINSSTLGNLSVYAGEINLLVNGKPTDSFCIDPWHLAISGPQKYNETSLANSPTATGMIGPATAKQIEQLWDKYYSPAMSNETAAGLQIAIWELEAPTTFSLTSGNDYGAALDIAWVESHPGAPTADLDAVDPIGPNRFDYSGQAYVIPWGGVPDNGFTVGLIGIGLLAMLLVGRAKIA
jgi:hypothetical protein